MTAVTRVALLAAFAALACTGPVGPFPDGHLSGQVVTAPSDGWPFADTRIVELEADPAQPHSVNVHFVTEGSHLWVATVLGDSSSWAARALADGRVRVRAGHSVYELFAVRVTDGAEIVRVAKLYREKYVISPEIDESQSTLVFRLDPR